MNRSEHVEWCKARALEYVDQGEPSNAIASMTSDLRKHPDTADHSGIELMMMLAMSGEFKRPGELRHFIEGFA